MQVKKFRAKTIKEATANVKNVLGPDAMILSSKKRTKKGCDDYFEITAMSGGVDISDGNSDILGEVKQELMTLKEMLNI